MNKIKVTTLEEIPVQKHHCIQLSVKTLHKALEEYIKNR
jgi:hypothetical protein